MNYVTHESSQYAEVLTKGDGHEVEFLLTLNCVTLGSPAQLYGEPGDCYPAEAAEFELESVHVLDDEGKPHLISEEILRAIVGEEVVRQMIEDAKTEAIESGEF